MNLLKPNNNDNIYSVRVIWFEFLLKKYNDKIRYGIYCISRNHIELNFDND